MIVFEVYYGNGAWWMNRYIDLHCLSGPASRTWRANQSKVAEWYYVNDEHHREDGPAHTIWGANGNKTMERYYVRGLEVDHL